MLHKGVHFSYWWMDIVPTMIQKQSVLQRSIQLLFSVFLLTLPTRHSHLMWACLVLLEDTGDRFVMTSISHPQERQLQNLISQCSVNIKCNTNVSAKQASQINSLTLLQWQALQECWLVLNAKQCLKKWRKKTVEEKEKKQDREQKEKEKKELLKQRLKNKKQQNTKSKRLRPKKTINLSLQYMIVTDASSTSTSIETEENTYDECALHFGIYCKEWIHCACKRWVHENCVKEVHVSGVGRWKWLGGGCIIEGHSYQEWLRKYQKWVPGVLKYDVIFLDVSLCNMYSSLSINQKDYA